MTARNQQLGKRGERRAERHYRRAGYAILARNLRIGRSEIDLLAHTPDGSTVVIVEVKTSSITLHQARARLDRGKRRRIAAAVRTLKTLGLLDQHELRIDGVLIEWSGRQANLLVIEGPVLRGIDPPRGVVEDSLRAASNAEGRCR